MRVSSKLMMLFIAVLLVGAQAGGSWKKWSKKYMCMKKLKDKFPAECPDYEASFEVDPYGNPIASGTVINTQFQAWGLTVSAEKSHKDGPNTPLPGAMIFDSANPSGGDTDLGTPNEACANAGPGTGAGGAPGSPGENCEALGNLLIISEDEDSSDPDDNRYGGVITFTWDRPVTLGYTKIVDNDYDEHSYVQCFDQSGALVAEQSLEVLGNNNVQELDLTACEDVVELKVVFTSSGGVAELDWEEDCVCKKCSGRVNSLKLRYTGDEDAQFVVKKTGKHKWANAVVFEGDVSPGETFELTLPKYHKTFGKNVKIFNCGQFVQKIHTSCWKDIKIGSVFGDFVVVDGSSRWGGQLCKAPL